MPSITKLYRFNLFTCAHYNVLFQPLSNLSSKESVCLMKEVYTYGTHPRLRPHYNEYNNLVYINYLFNLNHQIFLDDVDIFQKYCVVYERQRTVPQLRIIPFDKPEDQYVVQVHCKLYNS